jgi:hypothetical protein
MGRSVMMDAIEPSRAKPKLILASRLFLHLDPKLHPETTYVIQKGRIYLNVGMGWIDQGPASPSSYDLYPEVIPD